MNLKIEDGITEVVVTTIHLAGRDSRIRGRTRGTIRTVPFRPGEQARTAHQEAALVTALAELEKSGYPDAEMVDVKELSDPFGYRFKVICRVG